MPESRSEPRLSAVELERGQFLNVDDANEYIGILRRRLDKHKARRGKLAQAHWDIINADPVDLALDPTWAQRIAREAVGLKAADHV